MNYHLIPDDKFVDEFISVSESIIEFENRYIILSKNGSLSWVKNNKNLIFISEYKELFDVLKNSKSVDKLFFHSINDNLINFVNDSQLKISMFWIVWGWELYDKLDGNIVTLYDYLKVVKGNKFLNIIHHQKGPIVNKFKKNLPFNKFLKIIKGVLHYNKHDINLLCNQTGINIKCVPFFYRNVVDWDFFKDKTWKKKDINSSRKKILLGNSGTISNNHFSIINKKFKKINNKDIELIVPLSYGNIDYIDKVVEYGNKTLGNKFTPLLKFIEPKAYLEILNEIDFAIMNHIRSQGFGNITVLIYLGKSLFLNKKCTTSLLLDDIGIKYFNVDDFSCENLNQYYLSLEEQQINRELIIKNFSNDLQLKHLLNVYNLPIINS